MLLESLVVAIVANQIAGRISKVKLPKIRRATPFVDIEEVTRPNGLQTY